ncbi:MAG: hypothetical protein U1F98_06185 [Verrucomicrobiota bacterium]
MTIWLLFLVVMGSAIGMGLRQGGIRAAFTSVGIFTGALLAMPLGRLLRPLLGNFGVKDDMRLWLVPPVIAFILVLAVFKICAQVVHKKIQVHYKYKAGDLVLTLWLRLNARLGLCLGALNGTAYIILLSLVLYLPGYWAVQLVSTSNPAADPRSLRILSRLGWDLQKTGLSKVAAALERMPASYYDAADLVNKIYHTPLLEARLYRYPAFLGLADMPEFQSVLNDTQFTEAWMKQRPLPELLKFGSVQSVMNNRSLKRNVWRVAEPNLHDLDQYLTNGISQTYNDKILGRWNFSLNGTAGLLRKARPNISSTEMSRMKKWMAASFNKTMLVANPEHQIQIRNLPPPLKPATAGAAPAEPQNVEGEWKETDGKYTVSYSGWGHQEEATVEIEGDRLTLGSSGLGLMFERED